MKNLIKILTLITSLLFPMKNIQAVEKSVISKQQLTEMFDAMAKNTKWDLKGKMLWGYFFTDNKKEPLELNKGKLIALGYRFVDIYKNENIWWMHVEKEEIHSVESLFIRNQELYKFARDNSINSYDGMDVGPITKAENK